MHYCMDINNILKCVDVDAMCIQIVFTLHGIVDNLLPYHLWKPWNTPLRTTCSVPPSVYWVALEYIIRDYPI